MTSLARTTRRAEAPGQIRSASRVKATYTREDSLRGLYGKPTSLITNSQAVDDYLRLFNNNEERRNYTPYIHPTNPTASTENIQKNGHSVRKNPMPFWKARIIGSDEALEKPREAPILHNASPYATPYTRKHTPFIPPGDIIGHENNDEGSWEYAPNVTPVPSTRRVTRDLHAMTTTRHVRPLATVPETPLGVGRGLPYSSTMEPHNIHSISHVRTLAAVPKTPLDQLDNGKVFSRYEPPKIRSTDSVIWIEDIQSYQEGLSNDEDDYSERYGPPSGNFNDPDNYGSPGREPPEVRPTDSVIWIEDVQSYAKELYGPPSRHSSVPDNYGSPDHGLPGGLPGGPPRGPFGNPDQRIYRHPGRPHPAPGDEGPPEGVPPEGLQLPEDFQRGPQTQALPIDCGFNLEKTIKISNAPQGDGNTDFIPEELDGLNHFARRKQGIQYDLGHIGPCRLANAAQQWFHAPVPPMQERDQQSCGHLKIATTTYLTSQQWFDRTKPHILRIHHHGRSLDLRTLLDYFHHRFWVIQEVFVRISPGTIMETKGVAPQYWKDQTDASRINAIATLQKYIEYNREDFMRYSYTQIQDLERQLKALESRPANRSAKLARNCETKAETDLTKKQLLRREFTSANAQLLDDNFPNNQMVSIGETPRDIGTRACQYCGSLNHEEFDQPLNGTGNQNAKAFLSALYTGALEAFAAYEKCRLNEQGSDKDDATTNPSAVEEEADPQDFPEGECSLLPNADQDLLDLSSPRGEIDPGEAPESCFGRNNNENRKICDKKSLNGFVLENYCLAKSRPMNYAAPEYSSNNGSTFIRHTYPLENPEKPTQLLESLDNLSLHDKSLPEGMHKLLEFASHEWREGADSFKRRAHLSIGAAPGLRGKSKRRSHRHPGIAALAESARRILLGSISTNFPTSDLGLRKGLQFSEQPLSCRLINKEGGNTEIIIVAMNQGGRCPARIAATLVPQMATLVIDSAGTHGAEIDSSKFLRVTFCVNLPRKATPGSAAYHLYTLDNHSIPSHSRLLIPAGSSFWIPPYVYEWVMSGAGLSSEKPPHVAAKVTDSNYEGTDKASLHNRSSLLYQIIPERAMVRVLSLLLCQPPVTRVDYSSETSRVPDGFGATSIKVFVCKVFKLRLVIGRAPATTFLGVHPSKTAIGLNTPGRFNTQLVTKSGYINSSVSPKPLEWLRPPPKPGEERFIRNDQIIGHSSSTHYLPRDLRLGTAGEFVSMRFEAYIVGNMSAPLIPGNDCADRGSLSIVRKDDTTVIQPSTPGNFVLLESSVDHPFLNIQASWAHAQTIQPLETNQNRNQWNGPSEMVIKHSRTIPLWTNERLEFRAAPLVESTSTVTTYDQQVRMVNDSILTDSIISPTIRCYRVTSDTNTPVQALPSGAIGIFNPGHYYDLGPPEDAFRVRNFFNVVTPILQNRKDENGISEERLYQSPQTDLPLYESRLAKALGHEAIPPTEPPSPLNFDSQLLTQRKDQLGEVIPRNRGSSSLNRRIGECSDIKYRIDFREESVPIAIPTCHTPSETRADVDKQIDKWFSQWDFRESDSLRGALFIIVYRNGKWRICIDYREVNAVTLADEYRLPKRTDVLRALTGRQWFSISNALFGFHRLGIVAERHHITTFRTHKHGLLKITRLAFGRHNGSAVFQGVMNRIQAESPLLFTLAYNRRHNDLPPNDQHLDSVLGAIAQASITPSLPKYRIGYRSLFLGQRVLRLGNSTCKDEIDVISATKPPTKTKELSIVLGFIGYFADCIPLHTCRVARPLYRLLFKDAPWTRNPLHQEAYGLLKHDLDSTPVQGFPQVAKGYRLRTNSNNFGFGAALRRTQPTRVHDLPRTQLYNRLPKLHRFSDPLPQLVVIANKEEKRPKSEAWSDKFNETRVSIKRIITYQSRLFLSTENHGLPTGKEMLALGEALAMVRPLIKRESFPAMISTFSAYPASWIEYRAAQAHSTIDPQFHLEPGTPFYGQPASNGPRIDMSLERDTDLYGGRMKRRFGTHASLLFAQMDQPLSVATEVGPLDSHALASPACSASTRMGTHLHIDLQHVRHVLNWYEKDSHLRSVTESFSAKPPFVFRDRLHDSVRLIFFSECPRDDELYVPFFMQPKIMKGVHGSTTGAAHAGFERTYGRTTNGFFWPGMTRDIRQFVTRCPIFRRIKHTGPIPCGLLRHVPIPPQPVGVVTMVFMEELPGSQKYESTFVLICKLIGNASFIACGTTLAEKETAQCFPDKVVTYACFPIQTVPDRDTRSRSDFWNDICERMGFGRALTIAYHLRADGQFEVPDRTTTTAIRALNYRDGNDRSDHQFCRAVAYGKSPLSVTGFAPSCLPHGSRPHTPFNLLTQGSSIVQPGEHGFGTPGARRLAEGMTFVRLATKNALQPRLEEPHNERHIFALCGPVDRALINIYFLRLPGSKGTGAQFQRSSSVTHRIRLSHSYGIHAMLNISPLEPYQSAPSQDRADLEPLREDPEEFEVEGIIDLREERHRKNHRLIHQCQWKHYTRIVLLHAKEVLEAWKLGLKERYLRV